MADDISSTRLPAPPKTGDPQDADGTLGGEQPTRRVGAGFTALFTLAYTGFFIAVLAPSVISLPLKVNSLVGPDNAAAAFGLLAGVGALLALIATPIWGRLSDRTTSALGMRRPWMLVGAAGALVGSLVMAVASSVPVLLLGVCIAQVFVNAAGSALVAVLPDKVPVAQRGTVSGLLGVSIPVGLVAGTFLVQLVAPDPFLIFLVPGGVSAALILLFALVLDDRRLDPADRPAWSLRQLAGTYWVNPLRYPDFGWAWISRFLLVLAYAFLTTYQTFYLLNKIGSSPAEVPGQVFLATLVLAAVTIVSSVLGGRLSDATGRRKVFVLGAAAIYGAALFIAATTGAFSGFVIAMAVAGLGFGAYAAVDLALVADVLPDPDDAAKDMAVFGIASTLPQTLAPAVATVILALSAGSYGGLYAVAGIVAVISAVAILPVKRVR